MALTKVSTPAIKDEAITLAKLLHGDANSDGKFLRANNGADPSFETVSIPAGTTINNNADNRVITGSGTANTLQGEANLTFDGTVLQTQATAPDLRIKSSNANLGQSDEVGRLSIHTSDPTTPSGAGEVFRLKSISANANGADYSTELVSRAGSGGGESKIVLGQGAVGAISFSTHPSGSATERMRIDSSGRVGIGATSFNDAAEYLLVKNNSTAANISIVASNDAHSSLNLGDEDDFNIQKIKSDHTNNSLQIFTNNTERMRIDASGNVGIGVTDVKAALQVNSNKNAETDRHDGSNYHLFLRNPADDTGEACGLAFSVTSNATKTGGAILFEREGGGSIGSMQFYTNGDGNSVTERMRLLAGGGLTFNGDTAAANGLNDYEEGSFTPVLQNDGSTTYYTQNGKYTKIGNRVYFNVYIKINQHDGSSGSATGINLPFQNDFGSGVVTGMITGNDHWDTNLGTSNMSGWMGNGNSNMSFYKNSGQNLQAITVDDMGDGAEVAIAGHYPTNS